MVLWAYLKRQWKLLLLLVGIAAVFAAVFSLYDLPVEAVGYGAALCVVLGIILFLLGFFLILLAWRLLSRALDLVARLPGLHFLNKTGGALFGLVQGCIILFVAAWLLQFFGQMLPRELVEQTVLLKFFMTTNPFSLLG